MIGWGDRGGGQRGKAEGQGVENCCSAWLSSERRVCGGRRPAIFDSKARRAAGEDAVRNRVRPYLRRNRTAAVSPVS